MSRTPTDYYCEESIRKIMLSCNVCITCRKGLGVILSHQIVQLSFFIPIYMTVTVCRMIWEDSWYWYCTLWLRQAESGTITIHQGPVIMAFSGGPEEHVKPVQKRPEAKMLHEKKNFTIEKMAKFYLYESPRSCLIQTYRAALFYQMFLHSLFRTGLS